MVKSVCVLFFILISSVCIGELWDQKAMKAYELAFEKQGNERVKLFKESIENYLKFAEKFPMENGHVFYNIANGYFQLEDWGFAVLYYKKASRWIPGNPDLNYNLNLALNKAGISGKHSGISGTLRDYFKYLKVDFGSLVWFVFIIYSILFLVLILKIFLDFKLLRILYKTNYFLFCFFIFILGLHQFPWVIHSYGIVISNIAIPMRGPGKSYPKCSDKPLPLGFELEVSSQRENWMEVKLNDSQVCWIESQNINLI